MVSLSILGLPKSWNSYHDSFNGREKLLDWERMWLDLMQEEIKRNTRDDSSSKTDDDKNCGLAIKVKKGKRKDSHCKLDSYHGGKNKHMTKVKYIHYHELGHFATNCSLKKSSGGKVGEALASQFELEFSLIAFMVSSMMRSVWYLDSGA